MTTTSANEYPVLSEQDLISQLERIYRVQIETKEDLQELADQQGVSVETLLAPTEKLEMILEIIELSSSQ